MPEKILESVVSGQLDLQLLLGWLRGDNLEAAEEESLLQHCGRNEFTAFFLSFLRSETRSIVENDAQTRSVVTVVPSNSSGSSSGRAHRRAASDPTAESRQAEPGQEKKRSGRKVKTRLFPEDRGKDLNPTDERRSCGGSDSHIVITSTPVKSDSVRECITKSPALSTPSIDSRHDSRHDSRNDSRSSRHSRHDATLGDFLASASKSKKKKEKTPKSNDSKEKDSSKELDLSAEAFPDISQSSSKKSSSAKRRIKPTNIDLSKKSISLNNFSSVFQRSSPAFEANEVFSAPPLLLDEGGSPSPGLSAERAALRRERHRLLEKFSSLSAATSPKCSTPIIKVSQDENEGYVTPEPTKVTHREQIEILVRIYQALLDSNLVLSYTAELCLLLALVRGRQRIDVCAAEEETLAELPRTHHVLTVVHNAAQFAVRTLSTQRSSLAILLDRASLRALAEGRVLRAIAPELAKSLLDAYGVRGETPCLVNAAPADRVVSWDAETDGPENFPSMLSFHSFKKQRDMFCEIARWYHETGGGVGGRSLRARVRTLLAASNYPHLGVLYTKHAIATHKGGDEQSRLWRLQRRLTRQTQNQDSLFTADEEFYRDMLTCTENEPWRAAVRDALATQLLALDTLPVNTGACLVSVSRRTCLLAKLLGLLAALPYCQSTQSQAGIAYSLALRLNTQPAVDVHSALITSIRNHRLLITVPWTCAYLLALSRDSVGVRTPSTARLLRVLRALYRRHVPTLPLRTALYLRTTIAAVFALPNLPQELLYEEEDFTPDLSTDESIQGPDTADIVTDAELTALLGARRDVAARLLVAPTAGRHVTPLRVGPTPTGVNANTRQQHHIQRRLEEACLRACGGSGSRRVLELAAERVAARLLSGGANSKGPVARQQLQSALDALLAARSGARALVALAERAVRAKVARHITGEMDDATSTALRTLVNSPWSEQTATTHTPATPPKLGEVGATAAIIELKECVCLCLDGTPASPRQMCSTLERVKRVAESARAHAVRALLQLTIELCVGLALHDGGKGLTEEVLNAAEKVWTTAAAVHPEVCGEREDSRLKQDADESMNDKGASSPWSLAICPRVVSRAAHSGAGAWKALLRLILRAHNSGVLRADTVVECCVQLYRRDWTQDVLVPLGSWLRELAEGIGSEGGELTLMLGFLGEYCDDLA